MSEALSPVDGTLLARLAAGAVCARLAGRPPETRVPLAPAVVRTGASFVTLERQGTLRGCVGTLDAARPLYRDVLRNAVRAMSDPRLPPVTADDWPELDVKVSVLGKPEPLAAATRAELLALLRPGYDGLVLTDGHQRATFLPGVWEKLPDSERYLSALLVKGGWPANGWPAGLRAHRYGSAEFRDAAPRSAIVV